jgi:hypothetical protein
MNRHGCQTVATFKGFSMARNSFYQAEMAMTLQAPMGLELPIVSLLSCLMALTQAKTQERVMEVTEQIDGEDLDGQIGQGNLARPIDRENLICRDAHM